MTPMGADLVSRWLPLLLPLLLLQLALIAIAVWDLAHREKVRGGNKWVWLAVILLLNTLGPIIYLLLGRTDD